MGKGEERLPRAHTGRQPANS